MLTVDPTGCMMLILKKPVLGVELRGARGKVEDSQPGVEARERRAKAGLWFHISMGIIPMLSQVTAFGRMLVQLP